MEKRGWISTTTLDYQHVFSGQLVPSSPVSVGGNLGISLGLPPSSRRPYQVMDGINKVKFPDTWRTHWPKMFRAEGKDGEVLTKGRTLLLVGPLLKKDSELRSMRVSKGKKCKQFVLCFWLFRHERWILWKAVPTPSMGLCIYLHLVVCFF